MRAPLNRVAIRNPDNPRITGRRVPAPLEAMSTPGNAAKASMREVAGSWSMTSGRSTTDGFILGREGLRGDAWISATSRALIRSVNANQVESSKAASACASWPQEWVKNPPRQKTSSSDIRRFTPRNYRPRFPTRPIDCQEFVTNRSFPSGSPQIADQRPFPHRLDGLACIHHNFTGVGRLHGQ